MPDDHSHLERPIAALHRHPKTDIAVGVALPMYAEDTGEIEPSTFLALSPELPGVGETIFCFGFPSTLAVDMRGQHPEIDTLICMNPFWTEGVVQQHHPNGRDRVIQPGYCLQTDLQSPSGASGSPVMDRFGRAIAVVSSSIDDGPPTYIAPIADALDLAIPGVALEREPDRVQVLRRLLPFAGSAPIPAWVRKTS